MNKRIFTTNVILFSALLIAGISAQVVFAAMTASPTRGEKMLEDMINAESARSAELNVKLDPKSGIIHSLKRHSAGNDVKLLQQFLKVYGVYPEGLITGYFGPLTERAVKKFQEQESIDSVGIAGPKTRARIMEISRQRVKNNPTSSIFTSTSVSAISASTTPTSSVLAVPEIIDAVLTTDVAENGAAIASMASFASTTQNIYAVLSLKNAAQDTEVAYIRYFGNTYADSGVSHPSRDNLAYFHFQWSLKPGNNRLSGNYSLVFYLNGKSAKTIQYTIY